MKNEQVWVNPHKASLRLAINAFMIGSLFIILTLIFSLGTQKFSAFIIWQVVLAIPLLFVSSLAYTKVSYREKSRLFDRYAWVTHTIGNNMVLNAFGIIAAEFSRTLGLVYFALAFVTLLAYYIIDVLHDPSQKGEDAVKVAFIGLIFLTGGVYPLLLL